MLHEYFVIFTVRLNELDSITEHLFVECRLFNSSEIAITSYVYSLNIHDHETLMCFLAEGWGLVYFQVCLVTFFVQTLIHRLIVDLGPYFSIIPLLMSSFFFNIQLKSFIKFSCSKSKLFSCSNPPRLIFFKHN